MRALVCAVLLASPALAEAPRAQMFPSNGACYLRQYDAGHMAEHPDQLVTQVAIGPDYDSWADAQGSILKLRIEVQSGVEVPLTFAYCEDAPEAMLCSLEGDAGGFTLSQRDGAVLLQIDGRGMNFDTMGGFLTLSGTEGDDRSFLIPAVPADACP
jgi:hypothetical protein